MIEDEKLVQNSNTLGQYFLSLLKKIESPLIKEVRGKGLFIGMEINAEYASARQLCEALMKRGILSKETHETVVRFAPPLIITKQQINDAIDVITSTISEFE